MIVFGTVVPIGVVTLVPPQLSQLYHSDGTVVTASLERL